MSFIKRSKLESSFVYDQDKDTIEDYLPNSNHKTMGSMTLNTKSQNLRDLSICSHDCSTDDSDEDIINNTTKLNSFQNKTTSVIEIDPFKSNFENTVRDKKRESEIQLMIGQKGNLGDIVKLSWANIVKYFTSAFYDHGIDKKIHFDYELLSDPNKTVDGARDRYMIPLLIDALINIDTEQDAKFQHTRRLFLQPKELFTAILLEFLNSNPNEIPNDNCFTQNDPLIIDKIFNEPLVNELFKHFIATVKSLKFEGASNICMNVIIPSEWFDVNFIFEHYSQGFPNGKGRVKYLGILYHLLDYHRFKAIKSCDLVIKEVIFKVIKAVLPSIRQLDKIITRGDLITCCLEPKRTLGSLALKDEFLINQNLERHYVGTQQVQSIIIPRDKTPEIMHIPTIQIPMYLDVNNLGYFGQQPTMHIPRIREENEDIQQTEVVYDHDIDNMIILQSKHKPLVSQYNPGTITDDSSRIYLDDIPLDDPSRIYLDDILSEIDMALFDGVSGHKDAEEDSNFIGNQLALDQELYNNEF